MHSDRRYLLHRILLSLSKILGSQYHHRLPDPQQDLLVYELDLVDRRHTGQSRLAVGPQHDVVCQIDAYSHYILQDQYHYHGKKGAVELLLSDHVPCLPVTVQRPV